MLTNPGGEVCEEEKQRVGARNVFVKPGGGREGSSVVARKGSRRGHGRGEEE